METIGVLDACAQRVTVPLIMRATELAPHVSAVVSHPTQYQVYCRAAPTLICASSEVSGGIEWKQSVDMPEDCIHLETPDGVFLIKNLATQV